jgi:DNA replication and repair protein RecF
MLGEITARNVRLIQASSLALGAGFNLITGQNAAGKTTWLEAIHILCRAKPFSGKHAGALIRSGEDELDIRGHWRDGGRDILLHVKAGKSETNPIAGPLASRQEYAATAATIPVQVLGPTSHVLVDGGPENRRRWLDWGVFHVEHGYLEPWRKFNRALKQRNGALQQQRPEREIRAWDQQFIPLAEQLEQFRARYWQQFHQGLAEGVTGSGNLGPVQFEYLRGWPESADLPSLLDATRQQDMERGFTWHGPQRAELGIRMGGRLVREVSSRGQKKLLAFLMLLIQSAHASQISGRPPLLLVDDLASELDADNAAVVLAWLQRLGGQCVMTAIHPESLKLAAEARMFHVEHGRIQPA